MQLKMFCLCLDNDLLKDVENLNYLPVGLGKNNFSKEWWRDDTGENISLKINFMENTLSIIGFGKII